MKVRVLLIDDHDDARAALAERLRRDARLDLVGSVHSLEEAGALIANARPDVVLLDTHRRDGRGIDACRELRRLTDAPVVALASFMTPQLWRAFQEAGATDYLLKHVDTQRLGRSIVRFAGRHGEPR
ncbi:MAG: response regulator [Dehalococcoidia bacterium]